MAQVIRANSTLDDKSHQPKAQLQDAAEATAEKAASTTPERSTDSPEQAPFNIAIPPAEAAAQDEQLVSHITALVNRIYLDSESTFWKPGTKRTNPAEIRTFLRSRTLALAWRGDSSFEQHHGDLCQDLLGCVSIKIFPDEEVRTGEFGMLACEPLSRGAGVGRALVRFSEDEARRRGARRMRLELLQGDGWRHEFKNRLEGWYGREGYQLLRVEDMRKDWGFLVPLLARPTVMKIFVKEL